MKYKLIVILMTLSFSSQAAKITDEEILVCAFTNSGSCTEKELYLYQMLARHPLAVYVKVHKDN